MFVQITDILFVFFHMHHINIYNTCPDTVT